MKSVLGGADDEPIVFYAKKGREKKDEMRVKDESYAEQYLKFVNQPKHVKHWWKQKWATYYYKQEFFKGGPTGKDNKYLSTADRRANSFTTFKTIYSNVEKEIEEFKNSKNNM